MSDSAGVGFFMIVGALILAYNVIVCLISPILLFTQVSAPSTTAILLSVGYSSTVLLPALAAILAHKSGNREQQPKIDYYGRFAWGIMITDILLGITLAVITGIKLFSGTMPELGMGISFITSFLPISVVTIIAISLGSLIFIHCPNDAIKVSPQNNVSASEVTEHLLSNEGIAPGPHLDAQSNVTPIPTLDVSSSIRAKAAK